MSESFEEIVEGIEFTPSEEPIFRSLISLSINEMTTYARIEQECKEAKNVFPLLDYIAEVMPVDNHSRELFLSLPIKEAFKVYAAHIEEEKKNFG